MRHRRSTAVLALALAAATALTPVFALAGTVTPVELPATAPTAIPGGEAGELRSWVQLVWNPSTRALERVTYTAFDPIPSLRLELQWLPDDPSAAATGPISGKARWRA